MIGNGDKLVSFLAISIRCSGYNAWLLILISEFPTFISDLCSEFRNFIVWRSASCPQLPGAGLFESPRLPCLHAIQGARSNGWRENCYNELEHLYRQVFASNSLTPSADDNVTRDYMEYGGGCRSNPIGLIHESKIEKSQLQRKGFTHPFSAPWEPAGGILILFGNAEQYPTMSLRNARIFIFFCMLLDDAVLRCTVMFSSLNEVSGHMWFKTWKITWPRKGPNSFAFLR